MENKITVPLTDYEEKVRDQRSLEILASLIEIGEPVSEVTLEILCGLQVDKPEEIGRPAIMVESVEEPDPHIPIPASIPNSEEDKRKCLF